MKKKILLSLAATLIMVAGFATEADAQRRHGGPGVMRAGGGGPVGIRGGGFHRAGFVGGPRRFVGGHRFVGHRFVGHHRFVHHRFGHRRFARFAIAGGFVGAGYYGGCHRWRLVPTPWGPQYRLVNVCYAPIAYGYGYGAYPVGFYGGIY